jgi:hypothetical protein
MLSRNVRAYSCFLMLITLCASVSLSCRASIRIPINPMANHETKVRYRSCGLFQYDLHVRTCLLFQHSVSRVVKWIFLANRGDDTIESCLHTMRDVASLGQKLLWNGFLIKYVLPPRSGDFLL